MNRIIKEYVRDFFYDCGASARIAWGAFFLAVLLTLLAIWTYQDFDMTAKLMLTAIVLTVVSAVAGLKSIGEK